MEKKIRFKRIHFSVFRYRWSKNGFTGPRSFWGFNFEKRPLRLFQTRRGVITEWDCVPPHFLRQKYFLKHFCSSAMSPVPLFFVYFEMFVTVITVHFLRWLIAVSNTLQDVDFDGSLLPVFINWCYNHGITKLPNHRWTRWYQFRDTIGYHSNTMTC